MTVLADSSLSTPLDPDAVEAQLSSHPFVAIEGLFNVRELGGYASAAYPPCTTTPSRFFRAAELSMLTEDGKAQIKALGITRIFDLRSELELRKSSVPPVEIDGVTVVRVPVFRDKDYSPEMLMRRYREYAKGSDGFVTMYMEILEAGGAAFEVVLRHIKDRPNEGCLFHCTGGKDRTGVLSAIILALAGVADEDIATDYSLTRVGLEPMREYLLARIQAEPALQGNVQDGMRMLGSTRETMLATLRAMREKYGSTEEYLKKHTTLKDEDIETIRKNILVTILKSQL
ncbi:hypothetical protein BOTBODRAFT_156392 [Botryobasidium botryosum FD-172 SS1]|uniref:Tyrosine specific protein phosphatases domain-containing protein n=1 Tax=Botryobasidium botryosum (strain FD-172 SS1) TaxID=930990 RepID=A0A067MZS9_BOTB1|nr:hypothetical protein BOTBODRAFT_156392 [Botryobasidium botryosum FD-172 SS1]